MFAYWNVACKNFLFFFSWVHCVAPWISFEYVIFVQLLNLLNTFSWSVS
jgi:hypothetical protein